MHKSLIISLLALFFMNSMEAQTSRVRFVDHLTKGGLKPKVGEFVEVDFYVILHDTIIQSTQMNQGGSVRFQIPDPASLPNDREMPGLLQGLMRMGEGDSISTYELIDDKMTGLPPSYQNEKEVRIDVVLHKIISLLDMEKAQDEQKRINKSVQARVPQIESQVKALVERYAKDENFKKDIKTTPSGLKYTIFSEGKGARVKSGEKITVHYWGCTTDGHRFDDSFSQGAALPVTVGVGQVIPGWDEGLQLLNHGAMAMFFIPGDLAYGPLGGGPDIPPNAELIFYVEVQ